MKLEEEQKAQYIKEAEKIIAEKTSKYNSASAFVAATEFAQLSLGGREEDSSRKS